MDFLISSAHLMYLARLINVVLLVYILHNMYNTVIAKNIHKKQIRELYKEATLLI